VGSNPGRGMDVRVFLCFVLSNVGRDLAMDRSTIRGVLPKYIKRICNLFCSGTGQKA